MITRLNKRRKSTAGFTLIEMLVAVLIMGILLGVAIPLYLSSVKNTEDNLAKNNIKALAVAAAAFRVKGQTYPVNMAALTTPVATSDISDPSDGTIVYTLAGTASDEVITATAPAATFSNGTKWVYTCSTGAFASS